VWGLRSLGGTAAAAAASWLLAFGCGYDFDAAFSGPGPRGPDASDASPDVAPEANADAAGGKGGSPPVGGAGGVAQGGAAGAGGITQGGAAGTGGAQQGGAGGSAGTAGAGGCTSQGDEDNDGDGWSTNDGDCNDCAPLVNPGALDGAGPVGEAGVDDDCDGTPDNALVACDASLAIDDADPMNGARAIGLCVTTQPNAGGKLKTWGVISAKYVKADGTTGGLPIQHGLLPAFGAALPQQGTALLALSTGSARSSSQPGFTDPADSALGGSGSPPTGFPKLLSLCPGGTLPGDVKDPVALELQLRVPTNAAAFLWQFNFYTYDFPKYVCTKFNDPFIALLVPNPPGSQSGNIAFDQTGNGISVASALLRVCSPQTAGGIDFTCPLGTALLAGTGFEQQGATGWLQTQASATPGAVVTLRFAIWDSSDQIQTSTVLVDRFEWLPAAVNLSTTPAPNPK
jgi:hypothetical protein